MNRREIPLSVGEWTAAETPDKPVDDTVCHAWTLNNQFSGFYAYENVRMDMRSGGHKACRKHARFRVGRYVSCDEHLSYLVITSSPDWDGNMIAVEIVR